MKFLGTIFLLLIGSQAIAQETASSSDLRGRDSEVRWGINYTETYNEDNNELENEDLKIEASYLRNWGRFGLGIGLGLNKSYSENATAVQEDTSTTIINLLGRVNFIEDIPGNDLIPYFGVQIGTGTADSAGNSVGLTSTSAALGLKWYPLGEIFALTGELTPFSNLDLDGSVTTLLGVNLGMSLNF